MATLLILKMMASIVSLHVTIFITVYKILDLMFGVKKKKPCIKNAK